MKRIKEFDIVRLKDGRDGVIVETFGDEEGDVFLLDVGDSPKDWGVIEIRREDLEDQP